MKFSPQSSATRTLCSASSSVHVAKFLAERRSPEAQDRQVEPGLSQNVVVP